MDIKRNYNNGIDTLPLKAVYRLNTIEKIKSFLENNELGHREVVNGRFITIYTGFAVFDAYTSNEKVINIIPSKVDDFDNCIVERFYGLQNIS